MLTTYMVHGNAFASIREPHRRNGVRRAICPVPQRIFADTLNVAFGEKMKSCMSDLQASGMAFSAFSIDLSDPRGGDLSGRGHAVQGATWADDSLERSLLTDIGKFWKGTHRRSHFLNSQSPTFTCPAFITRHGWTQLSQTKHIEIHLQGHKII